MQRRQKDITNYGAGIELPKLRSEAIRACVMLGVLLFFPRLSITQNLPFKGVPPMAQYTPQQYGDHGKIWDFAQDGSGLIYMACNDGLLEFDGQTWQVYQGSKGITRSIVFKDSIIYSGSDLDFGFYKKNKQGWEYTSLYPYKNDDLTISEEFWNVYTLGKRVLFVSEANIYVYFNNHITKIPAPKDFTGSAYYQGLLYITTPTTLFSFDGMTLTRICELPTPIRLVGMHAYKDDAILVGREDGMWILQSDPKEVVAFTSNDEWETIRVFSHSHLPKGGMAIGTIRNGLFVLDSNHRIQHQINRTKGLLNPTILSVFYSSQGFLWLSLDYGIAQINLGSQRGEILDFLGDFGNPETAALLGNQFFLGSNQGLYLADWDGLNNRNASFLFKLVEGSVGQVWSLMEDDNQLLCGHDKGLFQVGNKKWIQIDDIPGVWCLKRLSAEILLTGNYDGAYLYRKEDGRWKYWKKIEGIAGSCVQIEQTAMNTYWIKIPNFGLVHMKMNDNYEPISRTNYNFDSLGMRDPELILIRDTVYLSDETQTKWFNRESGTFEAAPSLKQMKSRSGIALDSNYIFRAIPNGFSLEPDSINVTEPKDISILIRRIIAHEHNQELELEGGSTITTGHKNLSVEVVVPQYLNPQYRYRLSDDEEWSDWQSNGMIDMYNLSPDSYELEIQASLPGEGSASKTIHLRVQSPWFKSLAAILLYIALAGLLVYFLLYWQKKILKSQREQDDKETQLARLKEEWEEEKNTLLKGQQSLHKQVKVLEQKMRDKSIELAKKAKESNDKNLILEQLKEQLEDLKQAKGSTKEVKGMLRLIDSYIELDDKTFEIQIDELQQDYYKNLKQAFPDLSTYDLRLCAYVKLGLSSKEIAQIQGVLPSSVNVSRSRLRKKLNLETGDDLFELLSQF